VGAAKRRSLTERLPAAKQAGRARGGLKFLAMAFLTAGLGACGGHMSEGTDCPAADRAKTVSGFCVPRWVSLRHGEVMGRKGPGKDYPAQWVYHVEGLPVQIVAETEEWRRICDPDGGVTWVHRSEIDGRRSVMSRATVMTPIRRAPDPAAKEVGLLNARALAPLKRCKGDWCEVKVGRVEGWISTDQMWGVAPDRQCR